MQNARNAEPPAKKRITDLQSSHLDFATGSQQFPTEEEMQEVNDFANELNVIEPSLIRYGCRVKTGIPLSDELTEVENKVLLFSSRHFQDNAKSLSPIVFGASSGNCSVLWPICKLNMRLYEDSDINVPQGEKKFLGCLVSNPFSVDFSINKNRYFLYKQATRSNQLPTRLELTANDLQVFCEYAETLFAFCRSVENKLIVSARDLPPVPEMKIIREVNEYCKIVCKIDEFPDEVSRVPSVSLNVTIREYLKSRATGGWYLGPKGITISMKNLFWFVRATLESFLVQNNNLLQKTHENAKSTWDRFILHTEN